MAESTRLPGKFVWYELVSNDGRKAQGFYADVLGWKVAPMDLGGETFDIIVVGDRRIGSYAPAGEGQAPHWISYVSVEDVDAAASRAAGHGGTILAPPVDAPAIGRMARIADPQGAEIYLFRGAGDAPDRPASHGEWLWNELHTTDPAGALAFYGKVVGFTHRSVDDAYHIIGQGGVDRGGVSGHLRPGASPHWLPYAAVDDTDAAVERAKKAGAMIPVGPDDIPHVGRFAVIRDPVGALFAILKPMPM